MSHPDADLLLTPREVAQMFGVRSTSARGQDLADTHARAALGNRGGGYPRSGSGTTFD